MGRQQRDRQAEHAAISAAADRLLAGTPLRSSGKLTVSALITESGLRRDVIYGDYKDQVEAFQAKVRAQNSTRAGRQQLAAQNAGLHDKLTAVKAELAAERETGAVLRRMVAELSLELHQARNELAAAAGVTSLRATRPSSPVGSLLVLLLRPPAGRRSAVAGPDDAVFVGVDGDLDAVAQADFGEDAGDVALDSGLAEVEPGGDLGVGQSLGY
jgi:hypothetical protein